MQSGITVTGSFGYYGQVRGTITGDTFRGTAGPNTLEIRIGWITDGGGSLGKFDSCSSMAVKIAGEGWTDFRRQTGARRAEWLSALAGEVGPALS